MTETERSLAVTILEHIDNLLHSPSVPEIPAEVQDLDELRKIHDYLADLRGVLQEFSKGELTKEIQLRGLVAGRLKTMQSNLWHLTWQIQQVANGDFSQRVDFLGEFSTAFNSMVKQLNNALTELRKKEEELLRLTKALQGEIELKSVALAALRKSEANFRYKSEHDSLTGVLNRRSFYDMAVMEMDRAQRKGQHCCIAIFDIDRFKQFNDTYGHLEGDAAIRHITDIGKLALRQNDIMGRYGGDEIVILFFGVDKNKGSSIAERLRMSIEQTPVRTTNGDVSITISLGLAEVPPALDCERDTAFLEKVIHQADKALYAAKSKGRNKVVVSSFPEKTSDNKCSVIE